jgi:hypothetical protein
VLRSIPALSASQRSPGLCELYADGDGIRPPPLGGWQRKGVCNAPPPRSVTSSIC